MSPPGIIDTVKDSYRFLYDNRHYFRDVLFPLLPFLFCFEVGSNTMNIIADLNQDEQTSITLPAGFYVFLTVAAITGMVCQIAFIITWHRAAIIGVSPDHKVDVRALRPHEWSFIRGVIKYALALFLLFGAVALTTAGAFALSPFIGAPVGIAGFVGAVYVMIHLYLYLPARAVGNEITMKQSFILTKGMAFRLLFAVIAAAVPISIVSALCLGALGSGLGLMLGPLESFNTVFAFSCGLSLVGVFFTMAVIAVTNTVLSRYYIFAVNHKPLS